MWLKRQQRQRRQRRRQTGKMLFTPLCPFDYIFFFVFLLFLLCIRQMRVEQWLCDFFYFYCRLLDCCSIRTHSGFMIVCVYHLKLMFIVCARGSVFRFVSYVHSHIRSTPTVRLPFRFRRIRRRPFFDRFNSTRNFFFIRACCVCHRITDFLIQLNFFECDIWRFFAASKTRYHPGFSWIGMIYYWAQYQYLLMKDSYWMKDLQPFDCKI